MKLPALASFRRRILLRGVFAALIAATLAFAVLLLQDEKGRSHANYRQAFRKMQLDAMARLHQPAGQLALLNPQAGAQSGSLRPLVLPFASLDFDDASRALQAVEQAGCATQYADGGSLCAGVGQSAYAGAFLYLVGRFKAGDLTMQQGEGALDIEALHRATIRLESRGEVQSWVAPFERLSMRGEPLVRGRLIGFETTGDPTLAGARPVRDFRGWLSQSASCATAGEGPDCARLVHFAIRLPVEAFRESAEGAARGRWPPPDLDLMRVHVKMLAPGSGPPLFDSDAPGAQPPASLADLSQLLLPGVVMTIARQDGTRPPLTLKAPDDERSSPWLLRLIDLLPVGVAPAALQARESLSTSGGTYDVLLSGDTRGIDRGLGATATRMSWYVGAMLAAIVLAWLVVEVGLIRRITVLTRRAAAVSRGMQHEAKAGAIGELDVADLRGADELGILAGSLADLLQRVKDDVRREQSRAQRERDMLQAVGHEILSPLQSLMVLHPGAGDAGHRYVQRMQQAVKVLYGQASPSEALQAADIAPGTLDLAAFLRHVADNAHFAGVSDVVCESAGGAVMVHADEFALEDVVTHVLRNADRHRTPGTTVRIALHPGAKEVQVTVANEGPRIDDDMLERIFEYGVSTREGLAAGEGRGQGLFVARTYMAKMGGAIAARNEVAGVSFVLTLQRAN
jgi:signal transduction histidine kinase